MPGLGALALGAAPIAVGGLFGIGAAGTSRGPDLRSLIKQDLDLLQRIPEDQVIRRAALLRSIEVRIDDLVAATERARAVRSKTKYLTDKGNWRDIALFISAVLFVVICWGVNHHRTYWLPMFIAVILLAVVAGIYALRGFYRSIHTTDHHDHDQRNRHP